jgi:cytochrome b involved in lipid metabolism
MKSFTIDEVVKMADNSGCYIVVSNNKVYDVSSFINRHPGGKFVIKSKNGEDVTKHFEMHSKRAKKRWQDFQIGVISNTNTCCFT